MTIESRGINWSIEMNAKGVSETEPNQTLINRELSTIAFNKRVLELQSSTRYP